jgi:8-oxo-dGTP pyrophosphatase MutT (NUDIX family)
MAFPRAFQTYIPRSHCITSHVYGAIILNKHNETVVIRGRQSGKWSFPKGHGEYREIPLDACVRELREETGINMKGIQPDDEVRFRSGTYFVFFVDDRLPLLPEDTKEVMDVMWTPVHRLHSLTGNKDLTSFTKCININNILDKMHLKTCNA